MTEKKPFFSVVIPLYNKQNHVKETIETVLHQTFQDFEIVVVNDGSKDESAQVVETIKDERIRLIHQENAGVSVARNRGIKEANAEYIAFLDADDIWLPEYLETIYELIQNYPDAGLYATAYKKRKASGEESAINIQGLPSKEYVGLIPNYFESVVKGELLVWTSATCIPKKIFVENDIRFPVGEKYGEDQYVWARVAMKYDMAYNTKACSIYELEAENNTAGRIVKEPHQSILMLVNHTNSMNDINKLKYFNKYVERHILSSILLNMRNKNKLHSMKQFFNYKISWKYRILFMFLFLTPLFLHPFIKKIKNIIKLASK